MMENEPSPVQTKRRRNVRVVRHVKVALCVQNPAGKWMEIPGETQVLAQHGCLVHFATPLDMNQEFVFWWSEESRETRACVTFRRVDEFKGEVHLGVEFLEADNFWGRAFPVEPLSERE